MKTPSDKVKLTSRAPSRALSGAFLPPPEDTSPVRVLVVDDERAIGRILERILKPRGFEVLCVEAPEDALALGREPDLDVALVDVNMPAISGLELLKQLKTENPRLQVIMMSGATDAPVIKDLQAAGAFHFLRKPFDQAEAIALVVKAAEHGRLARRAAHLSMRLQAVERFGDLLGTSPGMRELYTVIRGVASTTAIVLIMGESGTGKELVARAIHQHSLRADRPFVPVNCGAIPAPLVESELFGHVRGAFTGASDTRRGLIESAAGGTLFLDEIGDLPLPAQVKLLRVLQEGEVKPVGADATRAVDARVVAATNSDLQAAVAAGTFRRDLYYRLHVVPIRLPPLRERGDDVLLLANHFVQKYALRFNRTPKPLRLDAIEALRSHPWPGNVRELEHAMENAVVLSRGATITPHDLPFVTASTPSTRAGTSLGGLTVPDPLLALPYADAKKRMLERFERTYVNSLLVRSGDNVAEAARKAGLDRSNLRRILRRVRAKSE